MINKSENKEIVLDLSAIGNLLTPISIFVSAILISATIFISTRNIQFKMPEEVEPIEQLAIDSGIDLNKFRKCVEADDKAEIQKDMTDLQALGTEIKQNLGTPSFVVGKVEGDQVNGVFISGAYPYESFKQVIDAYLNDQQPPAEFVAAKIGVDNDPVLGDLKKSKVAIIEFSDFECPYCKRFHQQTFASIQENYVDNGKIAFVYRDFPLSFHDPMATTAAVAANCVYTIGGSDKFFDFSKQYYEKTQTNGLGLPK